MKPLLDITLFTKKLAKLVGWKGPLMSAGWYVIAAIIIKNISPSFGKLTAVEQQLEGEYRAIHTELLGHSEEIAFYNGAKWEALSINSGFNRLYSHITEVLVKKFWMGIMDSMLVKYGAVMVGYAVLGLPVFGPGSEKYLASRGNDQAQITKDYVRNSSLLINLAKAIGRLVVSYKEAQSLAGYTTLIHEMDETLKDLSKGQYKRVMVQQSPDEANAPQAQLTVSSTKGGAKIVESDQILFKDVPILSPNGDELIPKISFEISRGMHLMITGPNGCGKSSLFRILGELWPAVSGTVFKPSLDKIFYIPQRPYLPTGSLRDQIIYPDLVTDQQAKKISDNVSFTLKN